MFGKKLVNTIRLLAKHLIFLVLGTVFALFIITFLLVGWPIYVYRWIVTNIIAPIYFQRHGDSTAKVVNSAATAIAAELLQSQFAPRCTLVVNLTIDGKLSYDKLYQRLEENWINFKLEKETLRYPELQQYPVPLMGFIFWKTDPHFHLKNHIVVHTLDENKSDAEVDKFRCQLIEELINKPYARKRSPWEIHLVQYHRESVDYTGKKVTGCNLILRIHHSISDGYSLVHILLEQMAGHNLEKTLHAIPKTEKKIAFRDILHSVTWPMRAIHELGHVLSWSFKGWGPLHVADGQKSWHLMYARMKPISISKLKYIKNTFKVSFDTVLHSMVAAALGRILKKMDERGKRNKVDNLLFGAAFPRPYHPKKLRLHAYFSDLLSLFIAFDIPVTLNMDPVDRLRKCEEHALKIKSTPMTTWVFISMKVFSSLPTRFAMFMTMNRVIAAVISNFPGPGFPVDYQEKTVLGIDFGGGTLPGVGGIGFTALSYADKIQICACAESAALEREELHELLLYMHEKFDLLHVLAEKHNSEKEEGNLLGYEIV